jgi:glutathione S-transferase
MGKNMALLMEGRMMKLNESLNILQRIAATYTHFNLTGAQGEKRIEMWCEMLKTMPYRSVLANVNKHIKRSKFPPTIAEIAAEEKPINEYLEKNRKLEASVTKTSFR